MMGTRRRGDRLFLVWAWACVLSILVALPLMAVAKDEGETDQTLTVVGHLPPEDRSPGDPDPVCDNNSVISMWSSSQRYKDQIQDLHLGIEAVQKLRPVTFRWKAKRDYDLGFIAEEVAAVDPILATFGPKGPEGVKYTQLTAVLVKALQELKAENETLKSRNNDLENRLSKIEELIQKMTQEKE